MKLQSALFLFLIAFFTIVSCQTPTANESGVDLLIPSAFVEAYQAEKDALLIDCRTPDELTDGQLDGAVNIDYLSPGFAAKAEVLDKAKPVYIYCRSGRRSAAAAKQLKTLGFEEIHDMKGGFNAYSKK